MFPLENLGSVPFPMPHQVLMGAGLGEDPKSLTGLLLLTCDPISSSLLQEQEYLSAQCLWSSSPEKQSQEMASDAS